MLDPAVGLHLWEESHLTLQHQNEPILKRQIVRAAGRIKQLDPYLHTQDLFLPSLYWV